MSKAYQIAIFFHLVGFAAYAGAFFAQTRLLAASARAGLEPAARDAYERLAAAIVTKVELPAILISILSGVTFIATAGFPGDGLFHGKLTAAVLLLVLSHLSMFNARKLVRARAAGADAEVEARKGRHAIFGIAGAILIVAIVAIVVLRRG